MEISEYFVCYYGIGYKLRWRTARGSRELFANMIDVIPSYIIGLVTAIIKAKVCTFVAHLLLNGCFGSGLGWNFVYI